MSVAGLRCNPDDTYGTPLETKSGSYIFSGAASGFHDWKCRTQARVLQQKEKMKREMIKDLAARRMASELFRVGQQQNGRVAE